jgi:hypothetical protein
VVWAKASVTLLSRLAVSYRNVVVAPAKSVVEVTLPGGSYAVVDWAFRALVTGSAAGDAVSRRRAGTMPAARSRPALCPEDWRWQT